MSNKISDLELGKIKTIIARSTGLSFRPVERVTGGYQERGLTVLKDGKPEFSLLTQYGSDGIVSCYIIEIGDKRYVSDGDKDWWSINDTISTYALAQREASKSRQ